MHFALLASLVGSWLSLAASALPHPSSAGSFGRHPGRQSRGNGPVLLAQADLRSPPGAETDIHVRIEFEGFLDGRGTEIKVKAESGLFKNSSLLGPGAFPYHMHTHFIASDGNCSSALSHLDTFNVTDSLVCDPAFPAYCQNGDLSGKHGKLNGTDDGTIDEILYTDDFVRWFPQEFSLLGCAVVVHARNGTRIACGNITSILDGTADEDWNPTYADSTFNPPSSLPRTASPSPPPVIIPINGTSFPSDEYLASLPHPWPHSALTIADALNVKLVERETFAGDLMPLAIPDDSPPPFIGDAPTRWGLHW